MEKDNVKHGKPLVIGGALREKLKAKIKEMIRQQMKEISASGAAGGSPADGSAGPVKTPYAFGKVKSPTTGLPGYEEVGTNESGTIAEKKKKGEGDEAPKKKKSSSGTPYTSAKVLPPEERVKRLRDAAKEAEMAAKAASTAAQTVTDLATAREKAMRLSPKKADNT